MFNPGFYGNSGLAGAVRQPLAFAGESQAQPKNRFREAEPGDIPELVHRIRTLDASTLTALKTWVGRKPIQFAEVAFSDPFPPKKAAAKPCKAVFVVLNDPKMPDKWVMELVFKDRALPGGVLAYMGGLNPKTGEIGIVAQRVKQSRSDTKGQLYKVDFPMGDLIIPYLKAAMQAAMRQTASRPAQPISGGPSGHLWAPPAARLILPDQEGAAKPRRLLKA